MAEHTPVKLLPCPFCGKKPHVFEINVIDDPDEPDAGTYNLEYSAKCECGIEMVDEYRDELAKRWNTRAAIAALPVAEAGNSNCVCGNDGTALHDISCPAAILPSNEALVKALDGWQDIETAPKDGSEVWVSGPMFNDFSRGRYVSAAVYSAGAWREDDESSPLYTPTHWQAKQPAPAPPAALKSAMEE